jgi:hypothetical protein
MTVLREKIKRFVKRMISEESPLMGMTSKGEQQFYTECADKLSDMDGAIVDLGCWMCSTAISLAKGIHRKQSERFGETHKVYAIDRFIWEAWMNSRLPEVWCDYQPGDSFLPEVRRRISAYQHVIELVQADLTDYS